MSPEQIALLILSCFAVSVASENVTTILKLEPSANNIGFDSYGTWRVVTQNGARGFPVRRGNIRIPNVWAGQACCETWDHDGWTRLSQEEALLHNPPLEVDIVESPQSRSVAAGGYKQDSEGVWRGAMNLDSRVRLTFVPPESGRASLAIYLCEFTETRDDQCVSVVMTGSSSDGKTLRYRTKRPAQDGSFGRGTKAPTSNHRKTYIVREGYGVQEGWNTNFTYHFRIERTALGDLEVELDEADPSQRRQIILPGYFAYNNIAVTTLKSDGSNVTRKLRLTADSAWLGDFSPGESLKVSFSPNSNDTGHLGFALCTNRLREHCKATVIDGIDHGKLVRNEPAYWTASFEDADKQIPDSSKNARWGRSLLTFTLSRKYNGTVAISVDDDDETKYTWSVPDNYYQLLVDTYHGEGTANVYTGTANMTASVWRLDRAVGELRSPPISEYYVYGDVCVAVAARVSRGTEIAVSVQRLDNKGSRVLQTLRSESRTQWIQKRIKIRPTQILREHKVQIVLTARQFEQTKYPVLVQWAAGCNPDEHGNEVFVKGFFSLILNHTVGFRSSERSGESTGIFGYNLSPKAHNVCQNDGLLNMDGKCICRPGFTGRLCEKACGPNRFGQNCESSCSNLFSPRECRGMWLCTKDLPCDCAPGLSGPHCDRPCEYGKYGVGCRQECGQCAYGKTCDPYSGMCTAGCTGPRLPPFCKTECGRSGTAVPLIGGGNVTADNRYPWNVGIYDKKFTLNGILSATKIEQICGGTMITPYAVISAAHCFWDERIGGLQTPDRYAVAFAKLKRGWDAKEKKPQEIQKRDVAAIHIPPDYQGPITSKKNDIAVLELMTAVNPTLYILPACFDPVGGFEEVLTEESVGYISGWGRTEDNIPSEDLKEARLTFISRNDCLRAAVGPFRPYVTAKDRFCAGDHEGTTVSQGDGGGGLLFLQSDNYFLRAVLSTKYANEKTFAVYTNVSYHRDWIEDELQKAAVRKAYKELKFFS